MRKIVEIVAYSTLTLTVLILMTIGFWIGYDKFNVPSTVILIDNQKEVVVGNSLKILYEVKRNRDCRVITTREIINVDENKIYELDPTDRDITKSNLIIREVTIPIPQYYVPGNYTYQAVLNYYCNVSNYFLGPIVIRTERIGFTVKDR